MTYVPVTAVNVYAWDRHVGAVARNPATGGYGFEYSPEWIENGIELSPLRMPAVPGVFDFGRLSPDTWQGLPPLIADTLPDGFGNRLVNEWMREHGIAESEITPLDRLAYAADRGIGALEYRPPAEPLAEPTTGLELAHLVTAARAAIDGTLSTTDAPDAIRQLLAVGTSAGGARAKALIAYNPTTAHIASPHQALPIGHEPWLIKLDGVQGTATSLDGRVDILGPGAAYGRIEYAYYVMATRAGIVMAPSRLLEENGRAHFLTRRFDRPDGADKLHVVTLCGLAHLDFNAAGEHSYDQYLDVVSELGLSIDDVEQAFRRMVFNVAAVNRDDHTKNLSFAVDSAGTWSLAPAYDLTYAHNPHGRWTTFHQMRVNGKVDEITLDDLHAIGERHDVPGYRRVVREVLTAVEAWPSVAEEIAVPATVAEAIGKDMENLRPRG